MKNLLIIVAVDEGVVNLNDGCRSREKEGSRWGGIYKWSQTLNQKPNAQLFKLLFKLCHKIS